MLKHRLLLSTCMHFSVDGISAAALMAGSNLILSYDEIVFCFCIYNLIAFGTQFLAGLFLDQKPTLVRQTLIVSCLLLTLGSLTVFGLQLQAIFLGMGNCLFHVALGRLILRWYDSCKQLGIFVSSGAIGLGLGLAELVPTWIFLVLYLGQVVIFLTKTTQAFLDESAPLAKTSDTEACSNTQSTPDTSRLTLVSVAILLLLCVVVRGFGGSNNSDYLLLFPCTFALGKILGGISVDTLGYRRTILLIFGLSFLALQWEGLLPTIILVLSFNMTMPLTLRLLHFCNPTKPGLMFGLAAGCLLPGFFFMGYFVPDVRAMAVGQFLILFIAGYFVRSRNGERILELPKISASM